MPKKKRIIAPSNASILIGNGFDINFGGAAYRNDFIIKRIIFHAKANRYDPLFEGTISGKEIAALFEALVTVANDIRLDKYDSFVEEDEKDTLADFKRRYSREIKGYPEIVLEDWFFIIKLYLCSQPDLASTWEASKQGLERLILDAIYNEGKLQSIYQTVNKPTKRFLSSFSNIFTTNYDNNLESLTGKTVYHLHGDFKTPANSENPDTVLGYTRLASGETNVIPGFEHCFCNALFSYRGDYKYLIANAFETGSAFLQSIEESHSERKLPPQFRSWIELRREHPELEYGVNYHFDKLRKLSGEIHILGMSPNNDNHLFQLIDKSNVDKIVFYYFSEAEKTLNVKKTVEYRKVTELWDKLDAIPPQYNGNYQLLSNSKKVEFIDVFNALSNDPVSPVEVEKSIRSIPEYRKKELCEMVHSEAKSRGMLANLKDEEDFARVAREISRIALREGILPTVLYVLAIETKWVFDYNN